MLLKCVKDCFAVSKMRILCGIVLLVVICTIAACTDNNLPEENVQKIFNKNDYVSKIEMLSKKEKIVETLVEDFDANGENEAFILTRKSVNEKEAKFNLWFVTQNEARIIVKNAVALSSSNLSTIKQGNAIHVLFNQVKMVICDSCISSVFGVENGDVKTLIKKNYPFLVCKNNNLYVQDQQYCVYDVYAKGWCSKEDVLYALLWDENMNQYVEPDATFLNKNVFLQYDGSRKVLKQIREKFTGTISILSFIKRENDTIDINMIEKVSSGTKYKWYVTLETRDKHIINRKLRFNFGNKKKSILKENNRNGWKKIIKSGVGPWQKVS